MLEFIAERLAAALIGLVLGLIIAAGLFWIVDIEQWWILVAIPIACCMVCALVGDRAVEIFKELAKWAQ